MGKINPDDLVGKQFGRLTVIGLDHTEDYVRPNGKKQTQYFYKCRCSCPNKTEVVVNRFDLTRNTHPTRSCGCINVERVKAANTIHGDSGTRFYHIWIGMNQRCHNPNDTNYSRYGALGVSVCDRWRENYLNFKEDMHESYLKFSDEHGEINTTLDRIDPFGNYCPENCQWATPKDQNLNKRETRYYSYNNEDYTIKQLYDNFAENISWSAFCNRINKLESNIVNDSSIFYNITSPIKKIDMIKNPVFKSKLLDKIEKDKEESARQLIAMRDGIILKQQEETKWGEPIPLYNQDDIDKAKNESRLALLQMMNN